MTSHTSPRIFSLLAICLSILFCPTIAISQSKSSKDEKRIETAAARAVKATEVLRQVAALPEDKRIPKDITDKMNLIGVIPDASQVSLLFSKGFRGYGLASFSKDGVWSMPAFYFFGKANGLDFTGVGHKQFDLIMVTVGARVKNKKDKSKNKDTANTADNRNAKDDKPKLYIYVFAEGTLKPLPLKTSFWNGMLGAATNIVYDEKLNKAVYGAKGDDILIGPLDSAKQLPPETMSFRDTVTELYPTRK